MFNGVGRETIHVLVCVGTLPVHRGLGAVIIQYVNLHTQERYYPIHLGFIGELYVAVNSINEVSELGYVVFLITYLLYVLCL